MDGAVGLDGVLRAEAVLDDHEGKLVAVIDLVQGKAKALGVDLPAPLAALEVGVLAAEGHVARGLLDAMRAHDVGHVVAEAVEVDRALAEKLLVAGLHLELDAVLLPEAPRVARIVTAGLDVRAVPVHAAHRGLVGEDVGRVASRGIAQDEAVHVAELDLGIVLVSVLDELGRGDELMVERLVAALGVIGNAGHGAAVALERAEREDRAHGHGAGVDLVEGEPIVDRVMPAVEHGLAVGEEEVDEPAIGPAVVLLDEVIGELVVADGHERLDAVVVQAGEDLVVELEAGLVGLALLARREESRPVDGHAEHREAHLGEEGDVLLVVVVEVGRLVARVERTVLEHGVYLARRVLVAPAHVIGHRGALAVDVPRSLILVRSRGAAPEEAFLHPHVRPLSHSTCPTDPLADDDTGTNDANHVPRDKKSPGHTSRHRPCRASNASGE